MHKGIILLVKAEDKEDAINEAESFLEPYGNGDVWDWYIIGGRWSGTLNKNYKKFMKQAKKILGNKDFVSMKDVEDNKDKLQKAWEDLGETSVNPYNRSSYDKDCSAGDILPAKECLETLRDWEIDMKKKAEEIWKKTVDAKAEEKKGNEIYSMSGCYAGLYRSCSNDYFSFESNLYDTVNCSNKLPKDLKGLWAVVVDMHN